MARRGIDSRRDLKLFAFYGHLRKEEQTLFDITVNILTRIREVLEDDAEYAKMSNASNPYGDGFACKRIADILEQ